MEGNNITPESIDEYISEFSPEVQEKLKTLRKVIKESAPDAEEKISYRMPTFVFTWKSGIFRCLQSTPDNTDRCGFFRDISHYKAPQKVMND
ncbi:MAG: iron chaperone [Bacillota bacterium]